MYVSHGIGDWEIIWPEGLKMISSNKKKEERERESEESSVPSIWNLNVDKVFRLFFVMYLFSVAIFRFAYAVLFDTPFTESRGFGCFVVGNGWWIWDGACNLFKMNSLWMPFQMYYNTLTYNGLWTVQHWL